jgi:hypothetical protein
MRERLVLALVLTTVLVTFPAGVAAGKSNSGPTVTASSSDSGADSSASAAAASAFTVAFSAASFGVDEGGSATLTVKASAASTASFSMTCTLAAGTATATTDFDTTAKTVVFAAGTTTASVSVATVDDLLGEAAETFTATLSNLVDSTGAATLSGTTVATVTIADNDAFEAQLSGVTMEPGMARIKVKRVPADKQGAFSATINVAQGSGRRLRGYDGRLPAHAVLRTLAVAAVDFGVTDAEATALLPLAAGASGQLVFSITGVSGIGATPSSVITVGSSATTTLASTVPSATPSVSSGTSSSAIAEPYKIQFAASSFSGVEGQSMDVTLMRDPPGAPGTATVDVVIGASDGVGDTADPNADYDAALQRVTFGEGVSMTTIYIPLVADNVAEATEQFAIRLAGIATTSGAGRASIGFPATVLGFIEAAQVSFASDTFAVDAGRVTAVVGLVLSRAVPGPITVRVTATSETLSKTADAVFAAQETSTSASIDLDALGLTRGGRGGTVVLLLDGFGAPTARDVGVSSGSATLTVPPASSNDGNGSIKGWEIPLIVLGATGTAALAAVVGVHTYRSWGAKSSMPAPKTSAAISDTKLANLESASSGHGSSSSGYGSSSSGYGSSSDGYGSSSSSG